MGNFTEIDHSQSTFTKPSKIPYVHRQEYPIINTGHPELSFGESLRLLIPEQKIDQRIAAVAAEIRRDYASLLPDVVLVEIWTGGRLFRKQLERHEPGFFTDERTEPMKIRSYYGARSTGDLQFLEPPLDLTEVSGKDVLVVEDIADTGLTLNGAAERISQGNPASIQTVVFLNKLGVPGKIATEIAYCCFDIDNEFVVGGYCLDHDERFRDLPDLWVLDGAV